MATKRTRPDRGFRSPPWIESGTVERIARLAEQLPVSASEIARQALAIGLDEVEKIVARSGAGLRAAAAVGVARQRNRARARSQPASTR